MRNVFGWSVLSVVLLSGIVSAQEARPGVRAATEAVVQVLGHQTADQQIATMIAACNRNEVEIAKFALPKLQSTEAKEIATTLIKDHQAAADKFAKWAGQPANYNTGTRPGVREGGVDRPEGKREERREDRREVGRERTEANPATVPGTAAGAPRAALKPAMTGGLNWLAVHQEMGEECLASCKKELSRYEGHDFDKAFLGHQIGGHLMAATNLKVLRRHASSQLATEIDEAHAECESHLKHIRATMEEKKDEKSDSKKRSE